MQKWLSWLLRHVYPNRKFDDTSSGSCDILRAEPWAILSTGIHSTRIAFKHQTLVYWHLIGVGAKIRLSKRPALYFNEITSQSQLILTIIRNRSTPPGEPSRLKLSTNGSRADRYSFRIDKSDTYDVSISFKPVKIGLLEAVAQVAHVHLGRVSY